MRNTISVTSITCQIVIVFVIGCARCNNGVIQRIRLLRNYAPYYYLILINYAQD
jgi:hypothetical protein